MVGPPKDQRPFIGAGSVGGTVLKVDLAQAVPAGGVKIALDQRKPKRACGDCVMCCKTMTVPSLSKPRDSWCTYCRIGKTGGGCTIYDLRPDLCASFECVWLQDRAGLLPDSARPDRSGVVLQPAEDGLGLVAHCNVGAPTAWRDNADIFRALRACAIAGYCATARVGNRYWCIGARAEVEILPEWMAPVDPDKPREAIKVTMPDQVARTIGFGKYAQADRQGLNRVSPPRRRV